MLPTLQLLFYPLNFLLYTPYLHMGKGSGIAMGMIKWLRGQILKLKKGVKEVEEKDIHPKSESTFQL